MFEFSFIGALASLPFLLALIFTKEKKRETLPFSTLKPFQNLPKTFKVKWADAPKKLYQLSFLLLALSLWDFRLVKITENLSSKEGIALFLVLDTSGSMNERSFYSRQLSKLDELKEVATQFVKKRPQDLIGLIAFARGADVISPLTLNHSYILSRIPLLSATRQADQDATSIGYALLKTLNLIETTEEANKEYKILSKVIILVTDGFENPSKDDLNNPLRSASLATAAERMKNAHIRLYIVNVEADFSLNKELEPQKKQEIEAAQSTGGDVFFVNGDQSLEEIFNTLNALEKSPLPEQTEERLVSLSPTLLSLALLLLICAFLLENTYLKRAP